MNLDRIIKQAGRRKEPSIYTYHPESYQMLSNGYWITLFISGILFMWAFHWLGLRTGIGWFFLSNFLSVILVRIEMIFNANIILWHENKKREQIFLNN